MHPGCNFPKKLHWREAAGVICWVCCSLCPPGSLLPLPGAIQAELLPNPVTLGHNTSPLLLLSKERKNFDFSIISMQSSYKTLPSWCGRILQFPGQSQLLSIRTAAKVAQIQKTTRSKDKKNQNALKKLPWAAPSMLWANFPWSGGRTGVRKLLLVLLLLSLSLLMSPS